MSKCSISELPRFQTAALAPVHIIGSHVAVRKSVMVSKALTIIDLPLDSLRYLVHLEQDDIGPTLAGLLH